MSEQKHTPGPWIVEFDNFDEALHVTSQERLDGDKVEIARVSVGYNDAFENEQQANARLIAAAPDMLEALKMAEDALKGHDPEWPYMKAIRSALSKALTP